jgi:hypothetical protein
MEKRSSPPFVLVLLVAMCIIALFVLLPATSPFATIRDSDGDGRADATDIFPNDNAEWRDTDKDGYGDNIDEYPTNPREWADSDNDSWPDGIDAFPYAPSEHSDLDGDSIGDNADAFPRAASQWKDSDGDGYGDNATGWLGDAFPSDRYEWNDSDRDGYGDNGDVNPYDPSVWEKGTARIILTLSRLADEGYALLVDDKVFASDYANISNYVVIEIDQVWLYGQMNWTQVQLTALSFIWSIDHWEASSQELKIVNVYDGGFYFLTIAV